MRMRLISGFKYELGYTPSNKMQCVTVSFTCDGYPIKRYVFVPRQKDIDCFNEAKKIVEKEKANGKLARYSARYLRKSKKPLVVMLASVAGIAAIAISALIAYQYLPSNTGGDTPTPIVPDTTELEVTDLPSGYNVTLTNEHSMKGKEYRTIINLNTKTNDNYYLPSSIDVTSEDEPVTNYQYKVNLDGTSADLKIPATSVTGKIKITLALTTEKPITKINIRASDDCVGVGIPEQQLDAGQFSSFDVNIVPDTEGHVVSINKIEFATTALTLDDDYTVTSTDENEYKIDFKAPTPYTISEDIIITAVATAPVIVNEISLDSSTLAFYDENHNLLPSSQQLTGDTFIVYVDVNETNDSGTTPLGLKIYNLDGELILGKDYLYEFISNSFAKLTILNLTSSITIESEAVSDEVIASFVYHASKDAPSESLTFEFYDDIENSSVLIDWGDGGIEQKASGDTDVAYFASHTFDTVDEDKDYTISLKRDQSTPNTPDKFGFDIYDDIVGVNKNSGYFSPDEPIAPRCSGIENITAIKILDNKFKGFTGEGIIHTSIQSLYLPDVDGGMFMKGGDGKYISYCNDLTTFHISENISSYKLVEGGKMLLELKVPNDNDNDFYSVVSLLGETSSDVGIVLDEIDGIPIKRMEAYAAVGREDFTSITFGAQFNDYVEGAVIDCPNLETINVDQGNTKYITGVGVNMLGTSAAFGVNIMFLTIRNTIERFDKLEVFSPFSFTGSNTPSACSVSFPSGNRICPFAFYHATNLVELNLQWTLFASRVDTGASPCIYGCTNLKRFYSDSDGGVWSNSPTSVIQNCPNIETLYIGTVGRENCIYISHGNAIYYITTVGDTYCARLLSACSASNIPNSFIYNGHEYFVNEFTTGAFNGNNVKEIFIPKKLTYKENVYPFVGCDGGMFISDNPSFEVDTTMDPKTGMPIQSLLYTQNNDNKVLLGASLLSGNKTLTIPEDINVISKYSISNSLAKTIVFNHTTSDSALMLEENALYGSDDVEVLDFSKLTITESSDVPAVTEDIFGHTSINYYYSHVKVYVKDNTAKELFSNDPYWSKYDDYGNIIVKE